MATGIDTRHSKQCGSRTGGRCNCAKTFQAHVYDARSGKRIRKTFPSEAAAKAWRQDAHVALRRGELSGDRGPTLNDALDRWLDALETEQTRSGDRYKPATIRDYRRTVRMYGIREALGHVRVRELRTQDAQRWIDGLVRAGVLAPATIDSAVTPLKAFYRRALVRGEATTNPFVGVLKPAVRCKTRRVATPVEAALMIDALTGLDRALWAVAFYAGLRRGELIGLRREDVNLATGTIRVERGWDMFEGAVEPKSRKGRRTVPVPAALRDYLDTLLLDVPNGPLFTSPTWVANTNARARGRWQAAGLPVLTLHEARHTYASLMIAAGVNPKTLSTFMGHATIAITLDLYGHLMPGSEDSAATLLDSYLAREIGSATVAPTVARTEKSLH
jgi:integrase